MIMLFVVNFILPFQDGSKISLCNLQASTVFLLAPQQFVAYLKTTQKDAAASVELLRQLFRQPRHRWDSNRDIGSMNRQSPVCQSPPFFGTFISQKGGIFHPQPAAPGWFLFWKTRYLAVKSESCFFRDTENIYVQEIHTGR